MKLTPDGPELHAESPEVWYATGPLVRFGEAEIRFLKEQATASPRLRARICAHEGPSAPIHEMLIAHHRSTYVRPHRHATKAETLLILEGTATAVFFDDGGEIRSSLKLAAPPSPVFSYRSGPGMWHSLLIRSEWLIFLEVGAGPFTPATNEFPAWAPDGTDEAATGRYVAGIEARLEAHRLRRP